MTDDEWDRRDLLLDRARCLDGPNAIVSHAEVYACMLDGVHSAITIAEDLGVNPRTVAAMKGRIRRAGLRAP